MICRALSRRSTVWSRGMYAQEYFSVNNHNQMPNLRPRQYMSCLLTVLRVMRRMSLSFLSLLEQKSSDAPLMWATNRRAWASILFRALSWFCEKRQMTQKRTWGFGSRKPSYVGLLQGGTPQGIAERKRRTYAGMVAVLRTSNDMASRRS